MTQTGTESGGKRNKLGGIGDKVWICHYPPCVLPGSDRLTRQVKKMVNTDVDELFGDVGELVEGERVHTCMLVLRLRV